MSSVTISQFEQALKEHKNDSSYDFINVCTPLEYKEKHIEGVRSVPLDQLEEHLAEFKNKQVIYIHCRSGARGRKAIDVLHARNITAKLINVEGGILAWEEAKLPVNKLETKKLPLMRQILLTAGALVLTCNMLGFFINPKFFIGSTLIGAGLTFSGITGWCGLALLLSKMPWNK